MKPNSPNYSNNLAFQRLFFPAAFDEFPKICKVLQENDINIRTLSLADTEQFGILRLLVKEWEKARDVLTEAGFIVKVTDVIALPVEDHPGGLAELLKIVDKYNDRFFMLSKGMIDIEGFMNMEK